MREFTRTRGFEQTDTPKNLAIALTVEAAELLEIFQWLGDGELSELSTEQIYKVKNEIADVFIYLIAISDRLKIDLIESSLQKMKINLDKYPPCKI